MNSPRFARSLAAVLLCIASLPALAEPPKSLLPVFGTEGAEFTVKGQNGHGTNGWLPAGWTDNSEWAQVNATYTKLTDSPDKDAGAVRIEVKQVDEGQLQFTTYGGIQKYEKGAKYVVSGWVRSASGVSVHLGARRMSEPYEFYHEQDLSTGSEWKRFEFAFTPAMDFSAFIMFAVRDPGTVDLAGVSLEKKP
jgi:hypothetical protein